MREAAGSVSPVWVPTWASILCAIFRFARNATTRRFESILARLARAEQAAMEGIKHKYDIIHFLQDIGMFACARYLEEKLRVGDPMHFWYPNRIDFNDPDEDSGDEVNVPGMMRA